MRYTVFFVELPADLEPERNAMEYWAFVQAKEQSKHWIVPATWKVIWSSYYGDYQRFIVIRKARRAR